MTDHSFRAKLPQEVPDAEPQPQKRLSWLLFGSGLVLLLWDQLTKYWARQTLADQPMSSYLFDFFRLTYAENSGAFLSLGADLPGWLRFVVMILLNSLLMLAIVVYLWRQPALSFRWRGGWCLVLIGGLGNLLDRLLQQGHVIDFMNLGFGPVRTGIFNFADVYLTIGFVWLAGCTLMSVEKDATSESLPSSAPTRLLMWWLAPLVLFTGWFQHVARGDTVIYKAGSRGGHVALKGEILEYNQREMVFRVKSPDTIHQLMPDQIVSYEANFLVSHQKAVTALAKRDYPQARAEAELALKTEARPWVRQELLAIVLEASINLQDWSTAATTFQAMIQSEPQSRHQDLIPLMWGGETLSEQDQALAVRELNSKQPAMQLISASWLLKSSNSELAAQSSSVLNLLLSSPQPQIRDLARCQLWRLRLQATDFTDGELQQWERQLTNLPDSYKAGPTFLLAQGYEKQVKPEQAAARYLWITIMDARRVSLARQATLQAAELLETVGQLRSAHRLRTEAAERF